MLDRRSSFLIALALGFIAGTAYPSHTFDSGLSRADF